MLFNINNSKNNGLDNKNHIFKPSIFIKLCLYFCKRKKNLNRKVINFLFHIIYLSVKDFEFYNFQTLKIYKLGYIYKILFIFLQFCYFILNSINKHYRMDSENFFSEKRELVKFLIYYKFFLFSLFLNSKNKFFNLLFKFSLNLHLNYLLYGIYYFLGVYLVNLKNIKSKINKKQINYFLSFNLDLENSYNFYNENVFNLNRKYNKKPNRVLNNGIPLYLFCSNRINFKSLDDIQFSNLLNNIRHIYRYMGKKSNIYKVLNLIVKQSIPLYKIIYQRRGRSLVPLMNFVYARDIRTSLGLKFILMCKNNELKSIHSYEERLFLNLVKILTLNIKENFVYQSSMDSDVRKEAYSKGYFVKTFKAQTKKI